MYVIALYPNYGSAYKEEENCLASYGVKRMK